MIDVQGEIFATLARLNRDWFDRAKSEARLASQASAKLMATHSLPDVTAAFRECHRHRLQKIANDSRRFFSESRKFMAIIVRLPGNDSIAS